MQKRKMTVKYLIVVPLMLSLFCTPLNTLELRAEEKPGDQIEEEPEEPEEKPEEEPEEEPEDEPEPIELGQPASFKVAPVKNGIKLSWKKVKKAQKYEVYRKKTGAEKYTLIKTTKNKTYTDKKAVYGVTYVYKARAIAISDDIKYKSVYSKKKKCCTYHIDPSKPMVALTFDDGPSQYTTGILTTLKKYESRATFFEVGNRVSRYSKTVLRISEMGCEIGNHSYDHPILANLSVSGIRTQISRTDKKVKAITGKAPALLRPPYGALGSNLRKNAKKPLIMWSIDTLDWKSRNADKVYQNVMKNVSDGDIILMHDLYSSTQKATERIVPALIKHGYQLVTISELAQYKKVKLSSGKSYSQM